MPRPRPPRRALDDLGADFELAVARRHAEDHPEDEDALRGLAYALTAAGQYEEALDMDRRLVERAPARPDLRYDLACSLALVGEKEAALTALEEAVALGFSDRAHLLEDEDLVALHDEPRWTALLATMEAEDPPDA